MMNNAAHKAISIRCATKANDITKHNDCKIDPDACARATGCSLISNEIDRRAHSQRMDKNRTYDGAHANHQWNQDRDFMNLRHRSTTNIPPYRVSRHSPGPAVSPRWHYLAAVVFPARRPSCAPTSVVTRSPPPHTSL